MDISSMDMVLYEVDNCDDAIYELKKSVKLLLANQVKGILLESKEENDRAVLIARRLIQSLSVEICHVESLLSANYIEVAESNREKDKSNASEERNHSEPKSFAMEEDDIDSAPNNNEENIPGPEEQVENEEDTRAERKPESHLNVNEKALALKEKTTVECPVSGRNQDATFNPLTHRALTITFVPLDPYTRRRIIKVTVERNSTVSTLTEKIAHVLAADANIEKEDILIADVWSNEACTFFAPNDKISRIRDSDQTYAYQLSPVTEIKSEELKGDTDSFRSLEPDSPYGLVFQLDYYEEEMDDNLKIKLAHNNKWMGTMDMYVRSATYWNALLDNKWGTHDERMLFLRMSRKFVRQCSACPDASPDYEEGQDNPMLPQSMEPVNSEMSLLEVSHQSTMFKNVDKKKDLLILNYCIILFYDFTMRLLREVHEKNKNGAVIEVVLMKESLGGAQEAFTSSLVLRISSHMTVYGLRKLIGKRLARVLRQETLSVPLQSKRLKTSTSSDSIIRRIPLTYNRKQTYIYPTNQKSRPLGSLDTASHSDHDRLVCPFLTMEQQLVGDVVGNLGVVIMHWSNNLACECFNQEEWDSLEV